MRLRRFADLLLRHPVLWIIAIVIATLVLGHFARSVEQDYTIENFFPKGDEEWRYYQGFKDDFEPDDNIILIGLKRDDLWENPQVWRDIEDISRRLAKVRDVVDVLSLTTYEDIRGEAGELVVETFVEEFPETADDLAAIRTRVMSDSILVGSLVSPDGEATVISVEIDPGEQTYEMREVIIEEIDRITGEYPQYDFKFSGIPYIRNKVLDLMRNEQISNTPLVTAMVLIILYFTFRNLRGLLLPQVVVLMSIVWAVGWMGLFGADFDLLTNVMPTILMVVGLADSIHLMLKYYEEREIGRDRKEALRETVEKLGMATLMTSVTTAIGFAVLYSANIGPLRNFGVFTAAGVLSAFVVSIVFLTLTMTYLKPPRRKRGKKLKTLYMEKWANQAARVTKEKPGLILLVSGVIVLLAAAGIPRININSFLIDEVPEGRVVMKDMRFFEREMSGIAALEVVVEATEDGAVKTPEMLRVVDGITGHLKGYPEIRTVISPSLIIKDLNKTMHDDSTEYYRIPDDRELIAQYLLLASLSGKDPFEHFVNFEERAARVSARMVDAGSKRTSAIIEGVRKYVARNVPGSYSVGITGTAKLVKGTNEQITFNLLNSLVLAFVIISILMGVLFRSLRWALISIVPNIIPLLVVAGVMGWFGIRLRITTAAVFSVGFGIAVDDTIHFLSRLKIEMQEGHGLSGAIHNSLVHTGKAIISTSVILALGFSVLMTSDFHSTFDFGLLTGICIVSALLADLYLLPILCERFGRVRTWGKGD